MLKTCVPFAVLFSCLLVITSGHAFAQSIPSPSDAGRLSSRYATLPQPKMASATAAVDNKFPSEDIVIPGADSIFLTFTNLQIEGMEAYPPDTFNDLVRPIQNKRVSLQQVIEVLNKISLRYRHDGFILSHLWLPEQDITGGIVIVRVDEGRIHSVRLEGGSKNEAILEPYLQKINDIYPFNINSFEHWLLVMNTLSGVEFKSILTPAKQSTGKTKGIDVVLLKIAKPPEYSLGLNNYGSLYAGPWQSSFTTVQNSFLSPYDQVAVNITATTPLKESQYGEISYTLPLNRLPGVTFNVGTNWGRTISGSNLKEFEIKGLSRELYANLTIHHLLSRTSNWASELGLKSKDTRSKLLGDELYDDRTRSLSLKTSWQHADQYNGSTLVSGTYTHGLNFLGARESGSFHLSRADGRSDFRKLNFQLSRLQNFNPRIHGLVQIVGQYSFTPVLSSEEFGFGGMPFGRGLDPSEITGDDGYAVSFELHYAGIPTFGNVSFAPYVFIDHGSVMQKGNTSAHNISATTAGLGTRVAYADKTALELIMAIPLTYEAKNPPKYTNGEGVRFMLSAHHDF